MKLFVVGESRILPPTWLLSLGLLSLGLLSAPVNIALGQVGEVSIQFARDIQPILSEHCFACHGPDPESREAGLRLDDPEGWGTELESGEGVAFHAGAPDSSVAVSRIESEDSDVMPPADFGKPLDDAQKQLLRRWVKQGAKWQQHWAYAPLQGEVPAVDALPAGDDEWIERWSVTPIDRFLMRQMRLADLDLRPNPKADPVTLIRRLYFDLTGLPPSPEAVDRFVSDPTPAAYVQLVDQLLASPAHAEHMTRYWLDWVRFADTVGYHGDQDHAAWPYRDYVLKSFADNLPFDQFTTEQLAGDLLPEPTEDQLIASAYNRLLQTTHEGGAQDLEYREKYLADRVRNFSEVWLASTMGCAQCHDHKYDPLTQDDFYSLGAFFADIDERGSYDGAAPNAVPTLRHPQKEVLSPLDRDRLPDDFSQQIETRLAERLPAELERERRGKQKKLEEKAESSEAGDSKVAEVKLTSKEVQRIESQLRARIQKERYAELEIRTGQCMYTRAVEPREVRLLPRGDWLDRSGPVVQPRTPGSMPPMELPVGTEGKRANRLDLARWLFQDDNPLPPRVMANRLWAIAFHKGISSNLGDFGFQGQWPSHPQLLDYLAMRLQQSWDLRSVLREIVLSEAYQQESTVVAGRDPGNRFYTRQLRPRLAAEAIRDNALAVSGLLVPEIGGPSVKPYQPAGYYRSLNFPMRKYHASKGQDLYRRGLYMHWQRQFLHPMLKAFDAPTREECTAERAISNTPSASLVLLNAPEFVEAARALALRSVRETRSPPSEKNAEVKRSWEAARAIERMFRLTLSRQPDETEEKRLLQLYQAQLEMAQSDDEAARLLEVATPIAAERLEEEHLTVNQLFALTQVARVLLNLDETITRY